MKVFLVVLVLLVSSITVRADDFFKFHAPNIQYLYGNNFELGPNERHIITLEYANAFKYGDFFAFSDLSFPNGGDFNHYTEGILRLSFNKMTESKLKLGPFSDLYLAGSLELPKGKNPRYLYGLSTDINVPGFNFLRLIAYIRDTPDLPGSTHQITAVWNLPFKIGKVSFLTEGVADFAGSEGHTRANQLIIPRLLVDTGALFFERPGKLFAGIEFQYWHNKFGIEGITESVVQFQLKWNF
ncbi:hypothetical protein KFE96_07095 [Kordiimonas sp. SCSIO 12603]|uniref:hypothetical protein n=1 Tax=Kordiimonas sp. SCSIO 12603 TaxID=2829596 RepID=UPI0021050A8A|nr:hypothetical protein [Kordiimonas sp. SCSIO 12603]UTW60069.1 hypothetical protein KFE96_07095 [Kordiimonas sp. SCSIO 12603]